MISTERATERPAPIRLPPARPNSSINLISDEPTSPARPRSATPSPSLVARKNGHEGKARQEAEDRGQSIPAAAHRLQTPWPKKDEARPPRTENEGARRSPKAIADLLAPRDVAELPAVEVDASGLAEGEAPRRHSDTPNGSVPAERQEGERRKSIATAASISCAYCTATGVNSTWRRDRSGKPLCGRCCEQLRRRMNPRQVSQFIPYILYCRSMLIGTLASIRFPWRALQHGLKVSRPVRLLLKPPEHDPPRPVLTDAFQSQDSLGHWLPIHTDDPSCTTDKKVDEVASRRCPATELPP